MTPCAKCERPICDGVACQDCAPSVVADAGAGDTREPWEITDVVQRALAYVAEFKGDARCSLNCMHAEALASEVARLTSALNALQANYDDTAGYLADVLDVLGIAESGEEPGPVIAALLAERDAATRRAEADQKAAQRWRALIASERVRVLGSAKLGTEYAHIGVEFWATFPSEQIDADAQARGVTWFVEYVDGLRALAASRAGTAEDQAP